MQVFLGLYFDFSNWKDVPMITVSNSDIRNKLGLKGKYASFSDIVDTKGKGSYRFLTRLMLHIQKLLRKGTR